MRNPNNTIENSCMFKNYKHMPCHGTSIMFSIASFYLLLITNRIMIRVFLKYCNMLGLYPNVSTTGLWRREQHH